MYNTQKVGKLDSKSRKYVFLGYANGVKRYRLWDPTSHKVVISRDVIFAEDKMQMEEHNSILKETTTIQMKNTQNHTSSEAAPEHEEQEQIESETPEVRRSTHERRPPALHLEYVTESNIAHCLLTEDGEPSTFDEAIKSTNVSTLMTAMQEEIEALHKNNT